MQAAFPGIPIPRKADFMRLWPLTLKTLLKVKPLHLLHRDHLNQIKVLKCRIKRWRNVKTNLEYFLIPLLIWPVDYYLKGSNFREKRSSQIEDFRDFSREEIFTNE